MLELGEDLLDGIEVGRIRGEEQEFGAGGLDGFAHGVAFVRGEIVHDNDVAGPEFAQKKPLDIRLEDRAGHRAWNNQRREDAVMPEAGDERRCFPMAVRRFADQSFAAPRPSVALRHIGRCAHFVDEHKAFRVERSLAAPPQPAGERHVAAILLTGEQGFF